MKLSLTVTSSETSVKDKVRRTVTVAESSDDSPDALGCVLTLTGKDDLLCRVGDVIDLQFGEPRAPRPARSERP